MTDLAEATEKLIVEHILPMTNANLVEWQGFREKEMYTVAVTELLQVNLGSIRKLFNRLALVKDFRMKKNLVPVFATPIPSIDQIVHGLSHAIKGVTDRELAQAFYLSKMTVAEETERSNFENTFLKWPEFIEFIARLAYYKYDEDSYEHRTWPLPRKIEALLEEICPLVGA